MKPLLNSVGLSFVLLLQVLALPYAEASAETWSGEVVRVMDGDTIEVLHANRPIRVRLANIDAPEKHQAFGSRSRDYLGDMVFRRQVSIKDQGQDRYGRVIGVVYIAGVNANAEMVRAGMAWVYRRYNTDPQLVELELQARAMRAGLWRDNFPTPPWEFRRAK